MPTPNHSDNEHADSIPSTSAQSEAAAVDGRRREIRSEELLSNGREVSIVHDGTRYVLRLTRQNKLILTK